MKTYLDCLPCFVRQGLVAVRRVSEDPEDHLRLMRRLLAAMAEIDLDQSPPEMGRRIHRLIRELTGRDDPYHDIKQHFNQYAMALAPRLRGRIERAPDPFETAVRLAIAGNSIDFGAFGDVNDGDVDAMIERAMDAPIVGSIDALRNAVNAAGDILYLGDNAGEIVFDRLLIERLPRGRTSFAVRGGAVINDVTRADAEVVGLADLVEVIDNGSDVPGTLLEACSPEFRARFERADLIITKGMGNYETLNDVDGRPIFFLLLAKCPIVAQDLDCREGDFVVRAGKEFRS